MNAKKDKSVEIVCDSCGVVLENESDQFKHDDGGIFCETCYEETLKDEKENEQI
jgi:uncharacterized Zn finger protein (UPF0148 family)